MIFSNIMNKIEIIDNIMFGSGYKFWSKKYDDFLIVVQKDDNDIELSIVKDTEMDVLYFVKITNELLCINRQELGLKDSFSDEIYISSFIYSINNLLSIHDSNLEIIIKLENIELYSEIVLNNINNIMLTKNIYRLNDMYKKFTEIKTETETETVYQNKILEQKIESKTEYKFKKRKVSITSNPNDFKKLKKNNPNKLFIDD